MSRTKGRGGKNWRANKRGGGRGGGYKSNRGPSSYGTRQDYQEADKTNKTFEKYYDELGILEGDEKEAFWEALRRELPNSFRFAGSKGHALVVQKRMIDHYFPAISKVKFGDEPVTPPTPIEWYPNKLAWQMTTPKNVVRKFAPFASFQKFLVSETTVGNISRQEIVSMIPPLFMNIKPGMTVLDMCAAPGSKSAQLIEMVHGGEEARIRKVLRKFAAEQGREMSPDGMDIDFEKEDADKEGDWLDDGRATGLLIANDVEYKRAQVLVHQTKRLNSPNIIVTNHDATMYPSIRVATPQGQQQKYLKFDRILCDVPCSGDGTARKNPNVWKDWTGGNGLGLHQTQVRILVRALQMLKVGGRVVYSTCSMNPVENEAVVSAAVDRCGGNAKVSVVDVSNELTGLKRRSGMREWKIIDKKGRMWSSFAEVKAAIEKDGEEGFGKLTEGMFPLEDLPEDQRIPLEHCVRVYPHLQDTGGFFITVLEKHGDIRARPENTPRVPQPKVEPEIKHEPTHKKPTIMDVVDEIAAQPVENILSGHPGHLRTLDEFAPSRFENEMSDANLPAAARANRENTPDELVVPGKRPHDDGENGGVEPAQSPKKLKVDHDRLESVQAPPAAHLDYPAPVTLAPGAAVNADEIKDEPMEDVKTETATEAPNPSGQMNNQVQKRRNNQPHEEPFKYLSPSHDTLEEIFKFYHIDPRFPRDRFFVRNAMGDPVKAIYYASSLCKDILTLNEGQGLKFVHCGVKMFMKQDAQGQDICRWRIQAEGIPILEAYVGEERVVRLYKRETLKKLLKEMFPKVGGDGWVEFEKMEKGFGERVRDVGMGCLVLRVERSSDENGFEERLVLPLWRSLHSLNLMLPKEERKAMLLRLFNDDSPLLDHSKERFEKAANATDGAAEAASHAFDKTIETETLTEAANNVTATAATALELQEDDDVKEAINGDAEVIADSYVDEHGGVKLLPKEDLMDMQEDRTRMMKDDTHEVAPGVKDEEDVFNTTV